MCSTAYRVRDTGICRIHSITQSETFRKSGHATVESMSHIAQYAEYDCQAYVMYVTKS